MNSLTKYLGFGKIGGDVIEGGGIEISHHPRVQRRRISLRKDQFCNRRFQGRLL